MAIDNGRLILAVFLVAALANTAAYVFNLFDSFFWFDKALHFYTSFAITLAVAYLWRERVSRPLRRYPLTLVLAVAALGLALGVLWEIAEWIADQLSGQDTIKGKTDTILDLILDGFGAVLAGLLAIPRGRNSAEAG